MADLVFVTTDASAKIPASQRGLIRSHCMRDKNKQPQSRRSKREAARRLQIEAKTDETPRTGSASLTVDEDEQGRFNEGLILTQSRVPPPAPSDWALIRFPIEMDRTSQMLFHRYFTCNPVRDPMFPFKLFGLRIDVHTDELWFSGPLTQDELFFRAMDLMVTSSNDLIYGCGLTNRTRRKLAELLPMLNWRLALPNSHLETIALYVVGILTSIATLFGDYTSASVHAKGLSQIISLRGCSRANPSDLMLGLALDRLSFSSSLLTDKWMPIHAETDEAAKQEPPQFPEEVALRYEAQDMVRSDLVPDARLALVFYTLQCTTILLNTHDFGAPLINGARLHQGMGFVQSELMVLKGQLQDNLSNSLRLSLMAFLATTFRVPGQFEHPCCASLAQPLLAACIANKTRLAKLPSAMQTWLLLVGAMTAGAVSDKCVQLAWRGVLPVPRQSWDVVRREVRRVMWIDAIHDALGRKAFDALCLDQ